MRRKDYNVKFTNKGNSRQGIASLVISAFSLIWLFYSIYRAFVMGTASGNVLGGIGMLALLLQLAALVFAIRSLREENVFRGIPKAAAAFSLLLFLLWAAVYGLGIYVMLGY